MGERSFPTNHKEKRLLKLLPAAGNRNTDGTVNNQGTNGNYWSSEPNNNANGYNLNFNASNVNPVNNNSYSNGFSVRCVSQNLSPCYFFLTP